MEGHPAIRWAGGRGIASTGHRVGRGGDWELGLVDATAERFNAFSCTEQGQDFIEIATQEYRPYNKSVRNYLVQWGEADRSIGQTLYDALAPTCAMPSLAREWLRGRLNSGDKESDARRRNASQWMDDLHVQVRQGAKPYTRDGLDSVFEKLKVDLVGEKLIRPGLTFHGLRKSLGKRAADAGFSENDIAATLGHSSPASARPYTIEAARTTGAKRVIQALDRKK